VLRADDDELPEFYTPTEITALKAGRVIFKNGALHADMVVASRTVTHEELVNG